MQFQDALRSVEEAAGWKSGRADADGIFSFELDEGPGVRFVAPDAHTLVLFCDLGPFPSEEEDEVARERIGALALAALRFERSILSVRRGRIELHRRLDLAGAQPADVVRETTELLNDAARWRDRLEGESAFSASPFSFNSFGSFGAFGSFGSFDSTNAFDSNVRPAPGDIPV